MEKGSSTHEKVWVAFAAARATHPNFSAKACATFADEMVEEWKRREFQMDESTGEPDIVVGLAPMEYEPIVVCIKKSCDE